MWYTHGNEVYEHLRKWAALPGQQRGSLIGVEKALQDARIVGKKGR